jgi:hypothetical protein
MMFLYLDVVRHAYYRDTPMTIKETLQQFDKLDKKRFDEHAVSSALRQLRPTDEKEISFELLSELMAFDFAEDYSHKDTGWGTYFGPMMTWSNGDGTMTESPSIQRVTPEMIDYWEARAKETLNPVLASRYYGLVWDFKEKISGKKPSHELCRKYISALLHQVNEDYGLHQVYYFNRLRRALSLAIELNDKDLIESSKQAILNAERKYSEDTKPGLWGYSFDLLVGNKKVSLSESEEAGIINELELKLGRLTSPENKGAKIDPWAAEAAAKRLATYFRKHNKDSEVKRVILEIGKAFDAIMSEGSAMQISGWYEHLRNLYLQFSLNEEAAEILLKLRESGPQVSSELSTISHSFKIPQEKIDKYVTAMTSGSLEDVLNKIATQFIPSKKQAKEQVLDLSKSSPLLFMIGHDLLDEKGRVVAKIGSLEDDIEGHIVRRVSESMTFSSMFLRLTLEAGVKNLGLNTKSIEDFIAKAPIINAERLPIIERGVNAYFDQDYIVAIHLIIPQIEEAIRNLIEISGGNVLRPKNGGYQLRTFDDLLRDDIVEASLGEDLAIYYRILFTDQRGWNLRNEVCHGIASLNKFDVQTADRLMHGLLTLGLLRKSEQ